MWIACDSQKVDLAGYLVRDINVPDLDAPDGTSAVLMAFGHRNVQLVELFLNLDDDNELKKRAISIAKDFLEDVEDDRDQATIKLKEAIIKKQNEEDWEYDDFDEEKWAPSASQYRR